MPFAIKLKRRLQHVDYKIVLPCIAKLPIGFGEYFAKLRGLTQWLLDYDWRGMAIGSISIRVATRKVMRRLLIDEQWPAIETATMKRFINNSREEWQALLFSSKAMRPIAQKCRIDNLQELKRLKAQKQGVVLISCHYDSFCMGMVLFGMQGLRVNVINTVASTDPRIHSAVRDFLYRKYRSMENLMHGKMPFWQTDMDFFYRILNKGEIVTLMGDVPGSKSTVTIPFLGHSFRLPLGAWHLARKTNSLLGAYVCHYQGSGRYWIDSLPCWMPDPEDPIQSLQPAYRFMESRILRYPHRWITADIALSYGSAAK
jgi:lauroyl/myristoyl acyltransferase